MRVWPSLLLAAVTACGGEAGCPLVGCISADRAGCPPTCVDGAVRVDAGGALVDVEPTA